MCHYNSDEMIGHSDIALARKLNSRSAFPRECFGWMDEDRHHEDRELIFKTTNALNTGAGPGTAHAKLSDVSPLPRCNYYEQTLFVDK